MIKIKGRDLGRLFWSIKDPESLEVQKYQDQLEELNEKAS